MRSNRTAKIESQGNEFLLELNSFERFSDDSSVLFKLFARSSYFEIRNYNFYSDTEKFKSFLGNIKKIYNTLQGIAEVTPTWEDGKIKISALKLGQIDIECDAFNQDGYDQSCKIGFQIDQTYLPKFINELEEIYKDLKFS